MHRQESFTLPSSYYISPHSRQRCHCGWDQFLFMFTSWRDWCSGHAAKSNCRLRELWPQRPGCQCMRSIRLFSQSLPWGCGSFSPQASCYLGDIFRGVPVQHNFIPRVFQHVSLILIICYNNCMKNLSLIHFLAMDFFVKFYVRD